MPPKKDSLKRKIKTFRILHGQYAILGISPSNQSNQKYSSDKRVLHGFLLFGWLFVMHFMYIFRVASGFMGYVESICTTSASLIVFVCFSAKVFRRTTLFESIESFERLINTSEPLHSPIFFGSCRSGFKLWLQFLNVHYKGANDTWRAFSFFLDWVIIQFNSIPKKT